MKHCIITNIVISIIVVLITSYYFQFNKETTQTHNVVSIKQTLNHQKPYCFEGLSGAAILSKYENLEKGDTLDIFPILQPVFLSDIDIFKAIPTAYLYEYHDSLFSCVDTVKYADDNCFSYIVKSDNIFTLFGRIDLFNGELNDTLPPSNFTFAITINKDGVLGERKEKYLMLRNNLIEKFNLEFE